MRHKRKSVVLGLLLGGGMLWFLGAYLQRLNGFDPPYFIFWSGFFMQPIGVLCIIAAFVLAAVQWLLSPSEEKTGVEDKVIR